MSAFNLSLLNGLQFDTYDWHIMKSKFITTALTCTIVGACFAQTYNKTSAATPLAQVAQFRSQGPQGLEKFLSTYAKELDNSSPQVRAALDAICQQKDCHASKLYWYTNIEQAKTAAKVSGKPILSLRLLGRLDEDLSCANSRFFRVALYPNAEVSKYLRQNYILHWQTVRSAPKVTVDFGDGRKLERTITGNSIHYILDSAGRPVDAIPGLYGPQAFLKQLLEGEKLIKEYNRRPNAAKENFLRQYHTQRLASIQQQWSKDLNKLGIANPPRLVEMPASNSPSAPVAGTIAVTKMAIEAPMLRGMSPSTSNPAPLREITDQATWRRIAQLYINDAKLDKNSVALINSKRFQQKGNSNDLQGVINNFETAMALDTVRNEYMLHRQIHQWFTQQPNITSNVNTLNERVYAQLFLTPSSDPWLGLMSSEAYSAIENDGVHVQKK